MDMDKAKKVLEEGEKLIKESGIDQKLSDAMKNKDSDKSGGDSGDAKSALKDIADKLKK